MKNKKTFGIVTIAPNEYVVHTRFGKIKNQGLGKTFVLLPLIDSYIHFSITPRKINFYADNITKEKQGVGIDGFLIWSIEDGERAYKKIDSYDSDAIDNLSMQLIDISVSIARNAISNMILEEVLTNREVLVEKLSTQLTSIIGDWGLKIEAMEIKEVRVLSETLFESMQAPFRNEQLRIAEHSRLEAKKDIENTSTETEVAVRIRKAEQEFEARAIEIDNQDKQKKIEHQARLKEEERFLAERIKQIEYENEQKTKQKGIDKDQALLDKELIHATEDAKRSVIKEQIDTEKYEIQLKAEKELMAKESEIIIKYKDLTFITDERNAEINYQRDINTINNDLSQEALMKVLYEELGESMKNMNFDKVQWYSMGDNTPMGALPKTIVEIATTLQSLGILNKTERPIVDQE
ncbi:MAG: SPFH domain-containing protein [Cyanobacteriota bacterium]